jgi:hypothetical protein
MSVYFTPNTLSLFFLKPKTKTVFQDLCRRTHSRTNSVEFELNTRSFIV